jgi:hypothetical protein
MVCIAFLFAAVPATADAAAELKILATDPAPDVLLARQQPFFVRFEVKSAAPVAVAVSGLYKGKAVIDDGGTSAQAVLPAGGGIGVVSFFYWGEQPTRINEVRLKINDAQSGANINEYAFPVTLTWLTDDPPPREPAAWVKAWQRAQDTQREPTPTDRIATSVGAWLGFAAGGVLLVIAAAWRLRRRARADDGTTRR